MEMMIDNCGNIIENPNANEIALYNELLALRNRYEILQSTYENRLKADLVAMLTELQLECEENTVRWYVGRVDGKSDDVVLIDTLNDIIQQKINALKADTEDQDGQTSN